jgi:hypothetical protein
MESSYVVDDNNSYDKSLADDSSFLLDGTLLAFPSDTHSVDGHTNNFALKHAHSCIGLCPI